MVYVLLNKCVGQKLNGLVFKLVSSARRERSIIMSNLLLKTEYFVQYSLVNIHTAVVLVGKYVLNLFFVCNYLTK